MFRKERKRPGAWRTRALAAAHYPVLRVDALRLKIRDGGHVRGQSGFVVTGGHRPGVPRDLGTGDRGQRVPAHVGGDVRRPKGAGLSAAMVA